MAQPLVPVASSSRATTAHSSSPPTSSTLKPVTSVTPPRPESDSGTDDYDPDPSPLQPEPLLRRFEAPLSAALLFPSRPPPPPTSAAPEETSLLHSARMKMTSRDQEAMRKVRSTMLDTGSASSSKDGSSPQSGLFPALNTPERGTRAMHRGDCGGAEELERTPRPGPSARASEVDYRIAVVGHKGVGKSTFVRKALKAWGMSEPVPLHLPGGHTAQICRTRVQPGGKLKCASMVEFVEVDMDVVRLSGSTWPEGMPAVSAAIVCYDTGRAETLDCIPDLLARLAQDALPTILLACKNDDETTREVEAAYGNSLGEPHNVGLIEVTATTSEGRSKMRNGLRWLLYKLEQRTRRQQRRPSPSPIRVPVDPTDHSTSSEPAPHASTSASTSTAAAATTQPPRPSASSSPSHRHTMLTSPDSDASSGADRIMWHKRGLGMTQHGRGGGAAGEDGDTRSSSSSLGWLMRGPLNPASGSGSGSASAVGKDAEGEAMQREASGVTEGSGRTDGTQEKIVQPDPPLYFSLEDLLNKLFGAIVSTEDDAFIRAFFLTYRRFCYPQDLMAEFLERYREVEAYAVAKDVQLWALMKLSGALIDWTTRYPGDLALPQTQAIFDEILALVKKYTFMAHLTTTLIRVQQSLPSVRDLDASWSLSPPPATTSTAATLPPSSLRTDPSTSPSNELVIDSEMLYGFDSSLSKSSAIGTPLSRDPPSSVHTGSTSSLSVEDAAAAAAAAAMRKRVASDPRLREHEDIGLGRWGAAFGYIVGTDPKVVAAELTRLQWELFAAIRPRDVFRHDFGKERDDPVGKAILFFNHLSRWVSTMILAHAKPKHRARAYERFMAIAHQLRRLNNYDSLYAVISGVQETSVHRLAQTHALVQVPPHQEREWQSHLKLMDPRGGYVHYRRAIQADLSNGRPAIPLLTTVLGLVSRLQAIRPEDTREDGMIQWDKFVRFGEILQVISDCQQRGPMVKGQAGQAFRALVEDTPIIDDEDGLFERSKMLEPGGGGMNGTNNNVLRRFVRGLS